MSSIHYAEHRRKLAEEKEVAEEKAENYDFSDQQSV